MRCDGDAPMITLYIKTHRVTGLKYFGKTTCDDPVRYIGGGKVWRRHLLKHGYDCDTEIYLQSEDQEYITREALRFSRAYDIVKSNLWANLQEENGIDGWTKGQPNLKLKGVPKSKEHLEKFSKTRKGKPQPNISKARKGYKCSNKHCEAISRGHSKTWIVTDPQGVEQIISNLLRFSKENGLDAPTMVNVSKGKKSYHKGWKCKKIS